MRIIRFVPLLLSGAVVIEAGAPLNDACSDARVVNAGVTSFTTTDATTDGPPEPDQCAFADYNQIDADVWFAYIATCAGTVTVDLCGSGYDTKVAVYRDCPTAAGMVVACNDDFDCDGDGDIVDDGFVSRVSFGALVGELFLIRVGGFEGATGFGVMEITCEGVPCNNDPAGEACDSDIAPRPNGDCRVNAQDLGELLAHYLAQAGETAYRAYADLSPPGAPDGIINNADLAELLADYLNDCR